jgi:hypothetical protein
VIIQNLKSLRGKVLVAPKVHTGSFEKEHPPFVIVGYVSLVWRYALKGGKVVVALQYLFEFDLNSRKVILQLFCNREVVGIKVLLIAQQTVLMEGLFKKPLDPQRTDLQLHHARLAFLACFSALSIRA